MLYIVRNAQGEICDIKFSPGPDRQEVSLHSEELKQFIEQSPNSEEIIRSVLNRLDMDMVRVIEDVIDLMIERGLMRFTDLPVQVQNKLLFKKNIRNLSNNESIIDDNELLTF